MTNYFSDSIAATILSFCALRRTAPRNASIAYWLRDFFARAAARVAASWVLSSRFRIRSSTLFFPFFARGAARRTWLTIDFPELVMPFVAIPLTLKIAAPAHHVSVICRLIAVIQRHLMHWLTVQILRWMISVKVWQSLHLGHDNFVELPVSIFKLKMRGVVIAPVGVRVAEVCMLRRLAVINAVMTFARAIHVSTPKSYGYQSTSGRMLRAGLFPRALSGAIAMLARGCHSPMQSAWGYQPTGATRHRSRLAPLWPCGSLGTAETQSPQADDHDRLACHMPDTARRCDRIRVSDIAKPFFCLPSVGRYPVLMMSIYTLLLVVSSVHTEIFKIIS